MTINIIRNKKVIKYQTEREKRRKFTVKKKEEDY